MLEAAVTSPDTVGQAVQLHSLDGTRLNVLLFGPEDAPIVVLAHGITNDHTAWRYQINELSKQFRVVAYDQRGHGRSALTFRARLTIEALGDDLQAVLARFVPAGEKAIVAGHSMGGISIMSWAARHPDEVNRRAAAVLLLNSAGNKILDHIALIGIPRPAHGVARSVIRQRVVAIVRATSPAPLRYLVFGNAARPEDFAHLRRMIRTCPPESLHGFVHALTRMDLLDGLSRLTVPVVVYAGQKDRLLPAVHSKRIAQRLPHLVSFVIRPGVGHMGQWEAADEINHILEDLARAYLP